MFDIDRIRWDGELKSLLRTLHGIGFIAWDDEGFTFKSKICSHVYVRGREDLTLHVAALKEVGRCIANAANLRHYCEDRRPVCLIGIPTAASPLAQAAAMSAHQEMGFLHMREVRKVHGMHQGWINGAPEPETHCYMTIENVVTSGTSLLENIQRLEEDQFPVHDMKHLVFVDREQGGVKKLQNAGYDVEAIFTLSTIADAFVLLGLWQQEQADAVHEEIRLHQFA